MWVAEYYACGPGDALSAAMPPATAHKTVGMVRLTPEPTGITGRLPEGAEAERA